MLNNKYKAAKKNNELKIKLGIAGESARKSSALKFKIEIINKVIIARILAYFFLKNKLIAIIAIITEIIKRKTRLAVQETSWGIG